MKAVFPQGVNEEFDGKEVKRRLDAFSYVFKPHITKVQEMKWQAVGEILKREELIRNLKHTTVLLPK